MKKIGIFLLIPLLISSFITKLIINNECRFENVFQVQMQDYSNIYLYDSLKKAVVNIDNEGNMKNKIQLKDKEDDKHIVYTEICVDDLDNIYALAFKENINNKVTQQILYYINKNGDILSEKALVNYHEGNTQSNTYKNLSYINGKPYVFEFFKDKAVRLVEIQKIDETQLDIKVEVEINLNKDMNIDNAYYIGGKEFYLSNKKGDIYYIGEDEGITNINLSMDQNKTIVPTDLRVTNNGNLVFFDAYNNNIVTYNRLDNKLVKNHINIELLNKKVGSDGINYISKIDEKSIYGRLSNNKGIFLMIQEAIMKIDKINLGIIDIGKTFGITFLIVLLLLVLISFARQYIIYANNGSIPLIVKQITTIVLTLSIFVTVTSYYFLRSSQNLIKDEVQNFLLAIAQDKAKAINGNEFENMNFKKAYEDSDKEDFIKDLAFDGEAEGYNYNQTFITSIYTYEDNKLYVAVDNDKSIMLPIHHLLNSTTIEKMERVLKTKKYQAGTYIKDEEECMYIFYPIKNSNEKVMGIIEVSIDADVFNNKVNEKMYTYILTFAVGALFILVLAIYIILSPLKNIQILRDGVEELAAGNFDTRIYIDSNDELEIFGNTFNSMTENINSYMNEVESLSSVYKKFVPEELIYILGKEDINLIKAADSNTIDSSILYFNIRNYANLPEKKENKELFKLINEVFGIVNQEIQAHGGITINYNMGGLVAVFNDKSEAIEKIPLYISSKLDSNKRFRKVNYGFVLDKGEITVGIIGDKNRLMPISVSETVGAIHSIDAFGNETGTKYIVTNKIIDNNSSKVKYRKIGVNEDTNDYKEIYEIYSNDDVRYQKLKSKTKKVFEEGIELFYNGNYQEARAKFINVLKINQNDEIAKYYVFKLIKT